MIIIYSTIIFIVFVIGYKFDDIEKYANKNYIKSEKDLFVQACMSDPKTVLVSCECTYWLLTEKNPNEKHIVQKFIDAAERKSHMGKDDAFTFGLRYLSCTH